MQTFPSVVLFFVVAVTAARADSAADWQAVAKEIVDARQSAPGNWDLPLTRTAYEKIVQDYQALRGKFSPPEEVAHDYVMVDVQRDIDVLTWEEMAVSPDDPHGMQGVVTRLDLHFQAGKADEAAKEWTEADDEYHWCAGYWKAVRELHPAWQPDFVAKQIQSCTARLRMVEANLAQPTHGPHFHPKPGGSLVRNVAEPGWNESLACSAL